MNIVWFKKDLRVLDQPALAKASNTGPCLGVYVFEDQLWQQSDMSWRHYYFLSGALKNLHQNLQKLGIHLLIRKGEICQVFDQLQVQFGKVNIYSSEETGNDWTFKRDIGLKKHCKQQGILWEELPQNGVVRALKNRDGWAKQWAITMTKPIEKASAQTIQSNLAEPFILPTAHDLALQEQNTYDFQQGGEDYAHNVLQDFLTARGRFYSKEMSSPVTAFDSCSRLSTYLSFGCISMRYVYQTLRHKKDALKELPFSEKRGWASSLQACLGRLRWHCHFIQKLEDEPSMQFKALHSAYRQLDDHENYDPAFFDAWKNAQTGFPFVDACMKALQHTGWLNFRMRAMLVSVACQHLNIPWPKVAGYLAGQFTDYEPGIHYSQCQMQAGVTGMNAIRIYNPIKQGYDQDPTGVFVKKWIPQLAAFPEEHIHEPWLFQWDYPQPLVDEKIARKSAADRLYKIRKNAANKDETKQLLHKHGSRRKLKKIKTKPRDQAVQGELF